MPTAEAQLVSADQIRSLLDDRHGPVVTISFPTVRAVVEAEENGLHLKSALPGVRGELEARGLSKPEVEEVLAPLQRLVEDRDYWMHQLDGLVLYAGRGGFFRDFKVPFEVDQLAVVEDEPQVAPLVPALVEQGAYVLALSQGKVRFFRAGRFTIEELDLEELDVPHSLAEELQYDEISKDDTDMHQSQIWRYVHGIDKGISHFIGGQNTPMILVGVEYLRSYYRQGSDYKYVVEDGINGNPDGWSPKEIHERVLPIIENLAHAPIQDAKENYLMSEPRGLASSSLSEIIAATEEGRVGILLLRRGEHQWGVYDATSRQAQIASERGPGHVDLLDLAARKSIQSGAEVFVVELADMPVDGPIAAVMRYAVAG